VTAPAPARLRSAQEPSRSRSRFTVRAIARAAAGVFARLRRRLGPLRLLIAVVITVLFVSPIYLTIVNAFKSDSAIGNDPAAPPLHPTLSNITSAINRPDQLLQLGLRNSLIVVVCSLLLIIPLGSAFSFWISRRRTRTRAPILALLAAGLMIPPQVVLLPTIRILSVLGIDHSYPGLILSNVGGGYFSFAVFVYVGFMRAVPSEVVEAARIDGAGGLRVWWSVVMPLVKPATATVAIFLSLWIWNDFLNPLFILGPAQGQTITTGIYLSLGQMQVDFGQMFAIMFLAAIIPVAGYLFTQKQFVAGLTAGSVR
jgi:raffinose/stachyose/melibiose transport system permease protein